MKGKIAIVLVVCIVITLAMMGYNQTPEGIDNSTVKLFITIGNKFTLGLREPHSVNLGTMPVNSKGSIDIWVTESSECEVTGSISQFFNEKKIIIEEAGIVTLNFTIGDVQEGQYFGEFRCDKMESQKVIVKTEQ